MSAPALPADQDTPLGRLLATEIAAAGPMPFNRFMGTCLGHPKHGYYTSRDPFGADGDFITAPEISQVFGELIGLWVADLWQRMGAPARFTLAEIGPGRGTLMADALRAISLLPDCRRAAQIVLVETSSVLRVAQAKALHAAAPTWLDRVEGLPVDAPLVVIANEFFDALPVQPCTWLGNGSRQGWHPWQVRLGAKGFEIGLPPAPLAATPHFPNPVNDGCIYEDASINRQVMAGLSQRLTQAGGAALIIDYGHADTACGETVQALHRHAHVPLTYRPGETDLTAHVDFALLAETAAQAGLHAHPLMTQAAFLSGLGISHRAAQLITGKPPQQAADLAARINRLTDPSQMGELFKVLAVQTI